MAALSNQLGFFRRPGEAQTLAQSYVPVLLVKRGERVALENVARETLDAVTPVLRVVPPELQGRGRDDPPRAEISRFAAALGERLVYLDAVGSPRRNARLADLDAAYARGIYDAAVGASLAFAPVYPFRRTDLMDIIRAHSLPQIGAAFLVTSDSGVTWGTGPLELDVREEVRTLGIEPSELDAIVELGYIPPDSTGVASTVRFVSQVVSAAPWRSIILAGTSVPDSVADEVPDDSLNGIERRERAMFDAVQARIDRRLRFGDYGVQHPVPPTPAPVPKMRASIRYTAGDFMFVSRGGHPLGELDPDDRPAEYREIAARLKEHPPFAGSSCCWGDRFVEGLADGSQIARGQHQMRAVATCHHVSVVARERTPPAANAPQGRGALEPGQAASVGDRLAVVRTRPGAGDPALGPEQFG